MRNLTGGENDYEYSENPKPEHPDRSGASDLHMSSDSPEHNDEGDSEMDHPFKNEVEIKGVPYPMPMYGGNMGGYGGGCGFGDGFGGGIGGLLVGALLGRGFGFGGGNWGNGGGGGDCVGGGGNHILATAILQQLANVQTQIPVTGLQTQAQIAESTGVINNSTSQQTLMLGGEIARGTLAAQQGFANVKDAVQASFALLNSGVAQVGAAVNVGTLSTAIAIRDDGDKTRALISSIDRDNLNRQLTVAENTITELRLNQCRREDTHGLEIQMTNNQNQNQLQFQAQAQGINWLNHGLAECNQYAKATNAQVNIGSGTLTGAAQNAAPVNAKL